MNVGNGRLLQETTWRIGGQQGEGIDATGDIMALVCNRLGYFVYANRVFSSRIKGGNTTATVRISTRPVSAPTRETRVLVALDQESLEKAVVAPEPGSCIIADEALSPVSPSSRPAILIPLPLTRLAREIQEPILRNTVSLGASAVLMGLPVGEFKRFTTTRFGHKSTDVVAANLRALEAGAEAAQRYLNEHFGGRSPALPLAPPIRERPYLLINGNHAVALGAIAAGCRLMASYPITPAYEVMDALVPIFPRVGGAVVQMEDELAALAFCLGAGVAGARAMTATSGPGLSLMQENLGLAIMGEVPLVLVDVQRAGPSSGMATKHEQSDLLAMLCGTHGDAPRIVLAPGDPVEAFADTILAFNLADRFHTPVILASDLSLGLWKQSVEPARFGLDRVEIDRGPVMDDAGLAGLPPGQFQRYATANGAISSRSLPGQRNGQFLAGGVEHDAKGNVTEDPANRVRQVRKRSRKLVDIGVPGVAYDGPARPEVVLVAFGSTGRSALEAAEQLRESGVAAGVARMRVLGPFPATQLAGVLRPADLALVVENNSSGQLAGLMRFHGLEGLLAAGGQCAIRSLLKFDGFQFYSDEIAAGARRSIERLASSDEGPVPEPLVVGAGLAGPTPVSAIRI